MAMAHPITVRKSTGSNQEVVVKSKIRKMSTTTMTIISANADLTLSSVNLLVGDIPTR